jgi:biuret amidohydrolase
VSEADSRIEPRRTAVVAIDFQHDVVGADGAFAPLFRAEVERTNMIAVAARLLDRARAAGATIVYSKGTFQPGYPELVPNIPVLRQVSQYGCLIDGSAGAAVIDEVAPRSEDIVLSHHRVSCFHGTELDVILRGARIDTVAIAGVATNLAVESTARSAADLGYRTLVVSDACSTTSESAHNASLESLTMLAEVMPTSRLLTALGTTKS